MKKNRSGIILVAEIIVVILFHTFKIRETDKDQPLNAIVKIGRNLENIPKSSLLLKAKPQYFFVNLLK
jgi:hypothetical protein